MAVTVGLSLPSAPLQHWPFSSSPSLLSPWLLVRVPADEDGTTQAQHIYHPLPAVDHCHRAYLPRGDPRGKASYKRAHTHTAHPPLFATGVVKHKLFKWKAFVSSTQLHRLRCRDCSNMYIYNDSLPRTYSKFPVIG